FSLPGLPTAGRPGRAGTLAGGALLGLVLVEHRLGRRLAFGAEFVAVVAAPLVGGRPRLIQPAEMRHDIAGVELLGALCRLPVRPVVRLVEEGAEGTLLFLQALNEGDRVIRGAAHPVAVFAKPFERVLAFRHDKAPLIVVGVAEVTL